jgi:hypothetical protein
MARPAATIAVALLALLLIHGVASLPDASAAGSRNRISRKLRQHSIPSIMAAGVEGMRKLAQAAPAAAPAAAPVAAPAAAPAAVPAAAAVPPCPGETPDADDIFDIPDADDANDVNDCDKRRRMMKK